MEKIVKFLISRKWKKKPVLNSLFLMMKVFFPKIIWGVCKRSWIGFSTLINLNYFWSFFPFSEFFFKKNFLIQNLRHSYPAVSRSTNKNLRRGQSPQPGTPRRDPQRKNGSSVYRPKNNTRSCGPRHGKRWQGVRKYVIIHQN